MAEFDELIPDFDEKSLPDASWYIDFDRNIVTTKISGIESIRQTALLILSTERYEFEIFSDQYGIELNELIGESQIYAMSEIKRRVTEALMQDDRITSVNNFEYKRTGRVLEVSFTITTSVGEFKAETEVTL